MTDVYVSFLSFVTRFPEVTFNGHDLRISLYKEKYNFARTAVRLEQLTLLAMFLRHLCLCLLIATICKSKTDGHDDFLCNFFQLTRWSKRG